MRSESAFLKKPLTSIERRRQRRAQLQAPLLIRRLSRAGADAFQQETAINVSLAGVYFESDQTQAYAPNDIVTASVSVPEAQQRDFPFTRLAGRGRVVRIIPLAEAEASHPRRIGVAVEFGEDLTVLTGVPTE